MNRSQQIQKIIGGAVKERGFEYIGYTRMEYIHDYTFKRKVKENEQHISVDISGNEVSLIFMTDANHFKQQNATYLIESDFQRQNDALIFESDEELKSILHHFKEIILQKSEEVFKKLCKPPRKNPNAAVPRKETYAKLYNEHEALNIEYREKYGLTETASTTKLIKQINDIILSTTDKKFFEVEEMLVGLAAVYSDQLIRKCGGEWELCENGACLIVKVRGKSSENPLATVINQWKAKIEALDLFIQNFRNNRLETVD